MYYILFTIMLAVLVAGLGAGLAFILAARNPRGEGRALTHPLAS